VTSSSRGYGAVSSSRLWNPSFQPERSPAGAFAAARGLPFDGDWTWDSDGDGVGCIIALSPFWYSPKWTVTLHFDRPK
jgi:hypothetical protein